MKISPARTAAFDILFRIEKEAAYSSVLLPLYEEGLSSLDRGLCHELVLGVLRRKMYLDRWIALLASAKKVDLEVRIALWLGLYQLQFLERVPAHSAINDSVELVARARKVSAKGFVNAILRKAAKTRPALDFADDVERLSVETSHPRWLIERWRKELGAEVAELAQVNNAAVGLSFRILADDLDIDPSWRPSGLVEGAYAVDKITAEIRELESHAKIYFQDEASQLVANVAAMSGAGPFLDVCAAPGGKTGLIARLSGRRMVVAGDLYVPRVRLLHDNLEKQGIERKSVLQYDAEVGLPFADGSFGLVLVDAPCSGTGTIRHNPEIRYSLSPGDIAALSVKQQGMLSLASNTVRPGGTLVYSTCSLEREEGEDVAAAFLNDDRDFEGIRPDVPERFLTADGFARTWPHRDGMDGFFIAVFKRR